MTDFKLGIVRLGRVAGKVSGTGRGLGRGARCRGAGLGLGRGRGACPGEQGPRGLSGGTGPGGCAGGGPAACPRGAPSWGRGLGLGRCAAAREAAALAAPAARGPRGPQRPSEAARSLQGRPVRAPLRACGPSWRFAQVSRGPRGPRLAAPPRAPPGQASLLLSRPGPASACPRLGLPRRWALRLGCFQEPAAVPLTSRGPDPGWEPCSHRRRRKLRVGEEQRRSDAGNAGADPRRQRPARREAWRSS